MYAITETPNYIHFGTTQPDRLVAQIKALAPGVTIYRDGDDWETWGESIATAEHVIVGGLSNSDALRLTADVSPLLIAMSGPAHQAGVLMSITDAEDWSEEVLHVTFRA